MSYEELLKRYIEEGYTRDEAEEKARREAEEQEHLEWLKYQDFIGRES